MLGPDAVVVDLVQHPQLAEGDQIVAIPTLVRRLPPPMKKIIGDLSSRERTLVGLDLKPRWRTERGGGVRPGKSRGPMARPPGGTNSLRRSDQAVANSPHYMLRLFVAGTNPRSLRAVENLRRLCEEHLAGAYALRVIDIYDTPAMAEEGQVVAAPTLVKELPTPLRRLAGDLADEGRVLLALGLRSGS